MNRARQKSIIDGLTGSARHVLNVVPSDEAISPAQVFVKLRAAGHRIRYPKVQGCLNDLESQRLVKCFPNDTFQRSE